MSILHHIRLVLVQIAKAPKLTLVLLTLVGAFAAAGLQTKHDLSLLEFTGSIVAVVLAGLFLKAAFMFFAFSVFNDRQFDGSFLLIAALVTPFLILALLLGSSVAGPHIDGFPTEDLPILLLGLYVLVVVFLFGAFRISHWFFGLFDRKRSTPR